MQSIIELPLTFLVFYFFFVNVEKGENTKNILKFDYTFFFFYFFSQKGFAIMRSDDCFSLEDGAKPIQTFSETQSNLIMGKAIHIYIRKGYGPKSSIHDIGS